MESPLREQGKGGSNKQHKGNNGRKAPAGAAGKFDVSRQRDAVRRRIHVVRDYGISMRDYGKSGHFEPFSMSPKGAFNGFQSFPCRGLGVCRARLFPADATSGVPPELVSWGGSAFLPILQILSETPCVALLPMFGKKGANLPNIGKGRSTLCFALPPLRVEALPAPSRILPNIGKNQVKLPNIGKMLFSPPRAGERTAPIPRCTRRPCPSPRRLPRRRRTPPEARRCRGRTGRERRRPGPR